MERVAGRWWRCTGGALEEMGRQQIAERREKIRGFGSNLVGNGSDDSGSSEE